MAAPERKTSEWASSSLRNLHRTLCYERGDHPDEIDTAASLGADALDRVEAIAAEKAKVEAELDQAVFFLEEHKRSAEAAEARVRELEEALREMVYETTHLSSEEDDGSHWCKISNATLARARAALSDTREGD